MLDKQTTDLLKSLNKFCADGSYKVLDKTDILSSLSKKFNTDLDALKNMIEHLQERNYLSVKYSDENVYCLAVLPKGRLFEEKNEELINERKKYNLLILTTMSLSCVSAFVGAFLAVIVSNLIF